MLRVGFAQASINVPPGLPMGGYARRSGTALGTAEPLLATAVALLAGRRRCAVISLDLVAVTTPVSRLLREALARFGFGDEDLILAATHTHSGPGGEQRELIADQLYYGPVALEAIERSVVRAVEAAADAAIEAELHAAQRPIEGIAASRVAGALSSPITGALVLARARSGQTLGAIAAYAAHPTVLGERNLYYSPDFVGPFRSALRKQLHGVPVVFLNGASGDLSTRSTRRASTLAETARLGGALAAQFAPMVEAARPIKSEPLATGSVSFEVQARTFPPAAAIERLVSRARAQYRAALDAGATAAETRTAENDAVGAEALAATAGDARDRRATITLRAIRTGAMAVVGVPAELFSELGQAIEKPLEVPFLLIATCADGYLSYILPAAATGVASYEALVSWVAPETGYQLVVAANRLLLAIVTDE